jgi:hypothetical protein
MARDSAEGILKSAREHETLRFSAEKVATILGLDMHELPAVLGVDPSTLRAHSAKPRPQAALRDLICVVSAALAVQPDVARALFFIKHEPVLVFCQETILHLGPGGTSERCDRLSGVAERGVCRVTTTNDGGRDKIGRRWRLPYDKNCLCNQRIELFSYSPVG